MITSDIEPDEVPFEEGYLKLRGFPPIVTKADVVAFMKVQEGDRAGCCRFVSGRVAWELLCCPALPA